MNLVRGELPDRLAAEYALGTLRGGARRRLESLLPAHPALRGAVDSWEQRLLPMALRAGQLEPPASVWSGIEGRLGWQDVVAASARPGPVAAAAGALQRALRFWRAFSAVASLAAVALAATLRFAPAEAPMVVVLRATAGTDTLVAGLSPDRREVSIQPLQPVALRPEKSLELWALPKEGKPASLGLVSGRGITALSKHRVPSDTKALAVTMEPLGGSPTGQPTGPVVFVGDVTL